MQDITTLSINAIRVLSAEAIDKAKSGHPGLPLGAAPIGYTLYSKHLKFNPKNPNFIDRDRFILSAGHGSMLAYSLLYLFGYGIKKEDLMNFRQLGSKTPGHPEWGVTPGVETSTGPLGQGIANAVGFAIAETHLASKFNKEGFPVVDHYTYCLCGDGCMQEGIENEAASLAGTLKLGKLIVLYDDNDITIEGNTDSVFSEDVGKRHEALGWQVIKVSDANDIKAIDRAIKKAKAEKNKPSLIICKSEIGYGSHLQGKADCHGAPLGAEGLATLKANLGWTSEPFEVPKEVFSHCKRSGTKGKNAEKAWKAMMVEYAKAYPEDAKLFDSIMKGEMPDLLNNDELWAFEKGDATRGTSSTVLNRLAGLIPNLIGGSADLGPSNKSIMKGLPKYSPEQRDGANMQFGVREHAMAAICNGLYLHGGLIPYCATFFVFSDYMKNAMRLSALMNIPVTYILTHDSIGVGEDGPTHQPIEQLVGLRAIPNLKVFRPADGKETTAAWISAFTGKGPTALVLTRQNLPLYENTGKDALKGGYILIDTPAKPDVILMASGSEVELIVNAQKVLAEQGVNARVVSMPCMELFESQSASYKEKVLPKSVRARVAVEAGSSYSWYKYVGLDGEVITIDHFGESAPAKLLFNEYGFTTENVVEKALKIIKK